MPRGKYVRTVLHRKELSERRKGKTKFNSVSILKQSISISKTLRLKVANGEFVCWKKGLTKENSEGVMKHSITLSSTLQAMTREERSAKLGYWKGKTKETDPRIALWALEMANKNKGRPAWNKGLTRNDHPSLAIVGDKNRGNPSWNKGLTKETDLRVEKSANSLSKTLQILSSEGKYHPSTTEANQKTRELAKDSEWVKKRSETSSQLWQTQEYREKVLSRIAKSLHKRPNKPELLLQSLLEELYPSEFEYNGDGKVIILGMVPDFINIDGRKEVVELFGDYWHSPEVTQYQSWNRNELGRIMAYNSVGHNCLIIWESELDNLNQTKTKIKNYFENSRKLVLA